jgi:hypothetical protein
MNKILLPLTLLALFEVSSIQASTIFLAGSEAASFHNIPAYNTPVFNQLQGTSTLPILVIDNFNATSGYYSGTYTAAITYVSPTVFNSMTMASLSDYSAIFFASPGTCCSDPSANLGSQGANVATFVAGGGSLYVEDYQGNSAWNPIIGLTVPSSAITSGAPYPGCTDPGVSTAAGLAFGFAPSYSLSCFEHQTYDPTYWAAQGYFALQVAGVGATNPGDWVTMATGFVEPGTVPEPNSIVLVGLGFAGLAALRRHKSA